MVLPSQASRKTKKKEGGALRAQRASSNVFSNFEQTQIQEFKEVRLSCFTGSPRPQKPVLGRPHVGWLQGQRIGVGAYPQSGVLRSWEQGAGAEPSRVGSTAALASLPRHSHSWIRTETASSTRRT